MFVVELKRFVVAWFLRFFARIVKSFGDIKIKNGQAGHIKILVKIISVKFKYRYICRVSSWPLLRVLELDIVTVSEEHNLKLIETSLLMAGQHSNGTVRQKNYNISSEFMQINVQHANCSKMKLIPWGIMWPFNVFLSMAKVCTKESRF